MVEVVLVSWSLVEWGTKDRSTGTSVRIGLDVEVVWVVHDLNSLVVDGDEFELSNSAVGSPFKSVLGSEKSVLDFQ